MRLAILVLAAGLTACSTANSVQLEPGPKRAAVPVDSVRIYRTAATIPAGYVEVAIVSVASNNAFAGEAAFIKALRKKAAALGANGLLLERTQVTQTGAVVDVRVNDPAPTTASAVAIFVKP